MYYKHTSPSHTKYKERKQYNRADRALLGLSKDTNKLPQEAEIRVQIFSADLKTHDCWVKGYLDACYTNKTSLTGYRAIKRRCFRDHLQIKKKIKKSNISTENLFDVLLSS